MDMKEKFDELHAKEVTPEVFEEVWGESKEEAKKKVMDFVERFLQAKTERDQKKHKRATRTEQKTMAIDFRPFDFAGAAVAAIMPNAALVAGAIAGMMEDENGKKKRIKKKTKEVKEIDKGELKGV